MMGRFVNLMLCLEPSVMVGPRLVEEFRAWVGQAPVKIELLPPPGAPDTSQIALRVNGMAVAIVERPGQPPEADWLDAVTRSRLWPEGSSVVPKVRSHLIVATLQSATSHPVALNAAVAVTLLCGFLSGRKGMAGAVFTTSGVAVNSAQMAAIGDGLLRREIPVMPWVALHVQAQQGTQGAGVLATQGLAFFVGREIELELQRLSRDDATERLLGLSEYLIVNGPVIEDGDTIGETADEHIAVRHKDRGQLTSGPVLSFTHSA